ncbi:hypothetical protein FDECE_1166 [Fusarium decemcellulare]|nr:hypothetical protein FDECE_1166 [Fusarium decemcellulare]
MIFTTVLVSALAAGVAAGPCHPSHSTTSTETQTLSVSVSSSDTSKAETTVSSTAVDSSETESTATSSTETSSETSLSTISVSETTSATLSESSTTESTSETTTADQTTSETTTTSTAPESPLKTRRPKGTVQPGVVIDSCTQSGVVALTFNSGPYSYTSTVLDLLDAAGYKGTFFVNGDNWASIYDYSAVVQRIVSSGHQLASYGWVPLDIESATPIEIQDNMVRLEEATIAIAGVQPTYMQPWLSVYDDEALKVLKDLAYKVITPSILTQDDLNQDTPSQAVSNFEAGLDAGGTIAQLMDVYQVTAEDILPSIIQAINNRGLTGVSVGTCLGETPNNWYY